MKITSAKFVIGITTDDSLLGNTIPQIAFIGRSNVGKSSLINSLAGVKGLAVTSSLPGRTKEINVFLINSNFYLVDLPGYGYARTSREGREKIEDLIESYLFNSLYKQKKVVLIIDANIGMTDKDIDMFRELKEHDKDIIVIANKIDKIKKSELKKKIHEIESIAFGFPVIQYSSKDKIGINTLNNILFK